MTFERFWSMTVDQQRALVEEWARPFSSGPGPGLGSFTGEEIEQIKSRARTDDLLRKIEEARRGRTD